MTEATWKVTNKRHDGISRPAADFTLSHQGTFVAAFANEQDATDAARAVNAHANLVAEWRAFFAVENEQTPEDEEAAQMEAMDLSEQAKTNLAKRLRKRR